MEPNPIYCSYCGRRLVERRALHDEYYIFLSCPRVWGKYTGPLRALFSSSRHSDVASGRYVDGPRYRFDPITGERAR